MMAIGMDSEHAVNFVRLLMATRSIAPVLTDQFILEMANAPAAHSLNATRPETDENVLFGALRSASRIN
jgi:hypothetical protein